MTSQRPMNNKGLPADGLAATRRRAREVGQRQAELAQKVLAQLNASGNPNPRWIAVLEHRINNPAASMAELASTMTPPMTKNTYFSLLRRLLRTAEEPS